MTKNKKLDELEQQNAELVADLQRIRADFENYRKRVGSEKEAAKINGEVAMVTKLLPTIDVIQRAIASIPDILKDNPWTKGIIQIEKNFQSTLSAIDIVRIEAQPGTAFDPEIHQALQMDDEAEGDNDVISEELQAGYKLRGTVIRPSLVKVTKK